MYQLNAFDGMTYEQAAQFVLEDPATTYALRQRIQDDARRDPLDCLTDAEVHHALSSLRVQAILRGPHRAVEGDENPAACALGPARPADSHLIAP